MRYLHLSAIVLGQKGRLRVSREPDGGMKVEVCKRDSAGAENVLATGFTGPDGTLDDAAHECTEQLR